MQRSPGTYTQGTIYGQIGTSTIIGQGTSWIVTDGGQQVSAIAAYDDLAMPGQRSIRILSIDDDQTITLDEPLPFGIPAGSPYVIIKRTVSPASATLGALQKFAAIGTKAAPRTYEAFGNGVSSFQLGFADDGRIELKVGAAGADGSAQNPWHSALLIDPATGEVTASGLSGGTGGQPASTFNRIWYIPGRPQNGIGIDGDLNIDFLTGFVIYGPKANGAWPPGLDLLAQVSAAAESAMEAAASASQAAQTLQTMQQNITAATQTAIDSVTANVKTALATATAEAAAYVAELQGRVFDFNLAIDPQTQTYAGGQDWNANV